MISNKQLKIALIKQSVYQDLYVVPHKEKDFAKILFSSNMRVGPFGLIKELDADYYIVHPSIKDLETFTYLRTLNKKTVPWLHFLPFKPINKIHGFKNLEIISSKPQGEYAINPKQIDWSQYDIIISINISLSKSLIKTLKNTLVCYMLGEANDFGIKQILSGYDCSFTQMARGKISSQLGQIDFPYTFLGPNSLQNILEDYLNRKSKEDGIYSEINMSNERPVKSIPKPLKRIADLGYKIRLHQPLLRSNLVELFDSKYFVKLNHGRRIRGNSVIEAISAGTLVLADPSKIVHCELIPKECEVRTTRDLKIKLDQLDKNPQEYDDLLKIQKKLVERYVYSAPLQSLYNCLEQKRKINYHNQ